GIGGQQRLEAPGQPLPRRREPGLAEDQVPRDRRLRDYRLPRVGRGQAGGDLRCRRGDNAPGRPGPVRLRRQGAMAHARPASRWAGAEGLYPDPARAARRGKVLRALGWRRIRKSLYEPYRATGVDYKPEPE